MRYLPAPNEPPMTTVNLGTTEQATAVTSLAPSRAMPLFSYSLPTMKPVMFCRNTSGVLRWLHSSMKCAPLRADSENRIPLFATIPTSWPQILANPQTSVSAYSCLNSWNRLGGADRGDTPPPASRGPGGGGGHPPQLP